MSRYKEILDKIEFSFSTTHLYEQCPYAVYMKKIEEIDGDSNAYAEIGSYGHELNEKIFKKKYTTQEALDECINEFDEHIFEYITESSKDKKYIAMCDYFSSFDEDFWNEYEVIGVELEVHWKIGKYNCIGYIDLILKRKSDGKIFLIDHKSASHFMKKDGTPLKNQEENFIAYKHQMYMYSDAIKKKLGFYPDYIVWNHFLDNGHKTIIPFSKEELNETLVWFKRTVKEIYSDEMFEPKKNYMMCYQLCDYRNGLCEYKQMWKEEESD